MTLTIHMMTAALAQGDAIGNYILALYRILHEWGCDVRLYADHPNPAYPLPHQHSGTYQPGGADILWMHYSIYSDNVLWLQHTSDVVIFDSHHVSPARLFQGYDPYMEQLCKKGEEYLDLLVPYPDLCVAHTDYVRNDLLQRGYRRIHKLPLIVDTSRFTGAGSPRWEPLLQHLDYLLFVGRVTPQKNLEFSLRVFAALHTYRPGMKYFLVGNTNLTRYAQELESLASELGIGDAVIFTGPISEPDVLTSFFRHARFYLCLSEWESFCVPIVEALHFGTPVLGHPVPPIPETMGAGGVVLCGSTNEMAEQIDVLCDNVERYAHLQRAGREHARMFTDKQLRTALLTLFSDLADWRI